MKICILSENTNYLLQRTAMEMGHEVTVLSPHKCYMVISPNVKGFDKLFYGDEGDKPELIKRNDFDCVINRIGKNTAHGVNVLTFMVENLGFWSPITPSGILIAADKGKCIQKLSAAGVKVPKTILTEHPVHIDWIVKTLGTDQIIIKTLTGSQGKTVAICDSKLSANSVLQFVYNTARHVLIEEFIESGATDYRVWVIGNKVVNVMKRTATKKGEFKANLSQGGIGEPAKLSKEDEELCIKAAQSIGLGGVAAVDLLKDSKEGTSYIIEINSNGGNGIVKATGVNHWESLIEYCETITGKKGKRSISFPKPGSKVTDPVKLKELIRISERDTIEDRINQEEMNSMRIYIQELINNL